MSSDSQATGWVGWAIFAGVILIIVGVMDALNGLSAIIGPNDAFVVTAAGNLFLLDVAGWGWWHLIIGLALLVAGVAVIAGQTWARIVAVILVALNAISQFALVSEQPWLSLGILALDVLIIYALLVHGKELQDA